jgi:hypothetical protein
VRSRAATCGSATAVIYVTLELRKRLML